MKSSGTKGASEIEKTKKDRPVAATGFKIKKEKATPDYQINQPQTTTDQPKHAASKANKPPKIRVNLEKIIGENLINKIGIAITIIGVAIGANYSIEHDLISPLTRIILGYLAGAGLLGFAIKLKKKYKNYRAVLVSGAIVIVYFITYSAYSFYGLIPQVSAFVLMVVFTAFAVIAALNYNKQVIAHIGLVPYQMHFSRPKPCSFSPVRR